VNAWLEHIKSKENKLEDYRNRSLKLRNLKADKDYRDKIKECL
jgi:hypothetical protein